jgi:hypothetical protein
MSDTRRYFISIALKHVFRKVQNREALELKKDTKVVIHNDNNDGNLLGEKHIPHRRTQNLYKRLAMTMVYNEGMENEVHIHA